MNEEIARRMTLGLLAFLEAISRDDRCEGSLIDVGIDQIAGEQTEPQLGRSRHTGQHKRPVSAKVASTGG
jgi:hypothetical protein